MKAAYPEQSYTSDTGNSKGEPMFAYFDLGLITEPDGTKRAYSEDFFFCNQWRKMGEDVWLEPTIRLFHIGFHAYG
jgi:hypothetical protein